MDYFADIRENSNFSNFLCMSTAVTYHIMLCLIEGIYPVLGFLGKSLCCFWTHFHAMFGKVFQNGDPLPPTSLSHPFDKAPRNIP